MIRLLLAALVFLSTCAGWAAEKPTLAVVNGLTNGGTADLLLSKLTASGEFAFVERERLAEVVREQQLSSVTRESNVRSGQLLGADALLFVETDRTLLHVRLVETGRGERLFDEVFPMTPLDADAVAAAVRARLARLSAGLRTPARDRLYVALGPVAAFRSTAAFRETLATVAMLVGVRLSQEERVLVVERENLAPVVGELALKGGSPADLLPADAIVRARLVDGDADKLSLEFQLQRPAGGASPGFTATVERRQIAAAAAAIAGDIGQALGVGRRTGTESTTEEARRQYRNGVALLQARLFEPALRYLETACLLEPAEERYAQTYLTGVATCLYGGGQLDRGPAAERTPARRAEEYLFYVDRLRSAMAVAANHPAVQSAPLAKGQRVFGFLGYPDALDGDAPAQVAACRTELRAFLERYAMADEAGWEILGGNCAAFISEPRAALDYVRQLAAAGHFPWRLLYGHSFPNVSSWDQPLARQLWAGFLDEVQQKPALEAQFGALLGRCWMSGASAEAFAPNQHAAEKPDAKAARLGSVQQLFAWLAAKEEHADFAAREEYINLWLPVWLLLGQLPLAEQDRYFEGPMMRFFEKAKAVQGDQLPVHYLSNRYFSSIKRKAAPDDAPQIRRHLDRMLGVLARTNPALHADTLASLRRHYILGPLMNTEPAAASGLPIPGGVLLCEAPGEETWPSFTGLADGDILWLLRQRAKALVITRVEMSRRTSETYEVPVVATAAAPFEQISMARSATHLIIADSYRVYALPVSAQAPFLEVARCQVAGPKFGKDDTGGDGQNHAAEYKTGVHFRRITAAFPAGEYIYIGLDERTGEDSTRYSALYRWRVGAAGSELLGASDSLQSGPLNDCLPYRLLGGCGAPAGEVYFVLGAVPKQPASPAEGQRRGLWKYTPAAGTWEQLSQAELGDRREPPRLRSPRLYDVTNWGQHWQLDLAQGTLRPANGTVSGADPARGWYHLAEKESDVWSEVVVRHEGVNQRTRLFSVLRRDGNISSLVPTEQGLVVLINGHELTNGRQVYRRLAYLLPREK